MTDRQQFQVRNLGLAWDTETAVALIVLGALVYITVLRTGLKEVIAP